MGFLIDFLIIADRVDAITHKTTHRVVLGLNNPPLYALPLRPGQPPALAIRNDVDVCLWLPQVAASLNEDESVKWTVQHEGTVNAFGYIQASKQQKKFIQCSPDMSYALICEPHRHIFIYKTTHDGASGLKNRGQSTKISIGQQKLVTMDEFDEVLGIVIENEVTLLLTQKHAICMQINA